VSAVPGTFSFTAKVTDAQRNVVISGTISIKVDAVLTITPPALPIGVTSVNYSSPAFIAAGGSGGGYTFAVASGSLPSPLIINSGTGIISGIPVASGISTFAVKVTDSLGNTVTTSNLSITIDGPPASITATAGSGQSAAISTAFTTALQATVKDAVGNLVPNVTVTFTAPSSGPSGTFTNGITTTAISNGSGVATASTFTANTTNGSYSVTASVSGVSTNASFSLTNATLAGPTIGSFPPTAGVVGKPIQYQLVTSSNTPATLAYSLSTAPAGMSIGTTTGLMQWTPASNQAGDQSVTILAACGESQKCGFVT
jgi:hypothetical protein